MVAGGVTAAAGYGGRRLGLGEREVKDGDDNKVVFVFMFVFVFCVFSGIYVLLEWEMKV
jgi:hypothetical protein